MRQISLLVAAALLGLLATTPIAAHHGWAWATNEEFVLSGTVRSVRHGNPHGTMVLATKSGSWTVEIGQPWRNEAAGLSPSVLKQGTKLVVHGHRSAKKGQRLMKAERIVIAGKSFNLYPDRPS